MNSPHVWDNPSLATPIMPRRVILLILALTGFALLAPAQEPEPRRHTKDKEAPGIGARDSGPETIMQIVRKEGLAARPRPPRVTAERLAFGAEVRTSVGQRRRFALE